MCLGAPRDSDDGCTTAAPARGGAACLRCDANMQCHVPSARCGECRVRQGQALHTVTFSLPVDVSRVNGTMIDLPNGRAVVRGGSTFTRERRPQPRANVNERTSRITILYSIAGCV